MKRYGEAIEITEARFHHYTDGKYYKVEDIKNEILPVLKECLNYIDFHYNETKDSDDIQFDIQFDNRINKLIEELNQ